MFTHGTPCHWYFTHRRRATAHMQVFTHITWHKCFTNGIRCYRCFTHGALCHRYFTLRTPCHIEVFIHEIRSLVSWGARYTLLCRGFDSHRHAQSLKENKNCFSTHHVNNKKIHRAACHRCLQNRLTPCYRYSLDAGHHVHIEVVNRQGYRPTGVYTWDTVPQV